MSEPSRRVIPEQGEFDEEPGEGRPPRRASRTWLVRGLGVALGVIVYFLLSGSGLSNDARVVAGVGTLMAVWWMTEAVPLSVTSLLPIALMPVLTERTIAETTAPYANPIVFLFLGGFLIAIAMQKWNLHRRIALLTLRRVGTHPRQIILGLMISTAFLSMWVSNTATTLMMLPIALSVLTLVVENSKHGAEAAVGTGGRDVGEELRAGGAVSDLIENREVRVFGVALVLAVAWSATIGGLGTLLGSPPNAIVAGYISDELGKTVGFAQWMMLGVPIVVVFIGLAWLLLTRFIFRFHLDEVPGGKQLINDEIAALGPMSQGEKATPPQRPPSFPSWAGWPSASVSTPWRS